MLAVLGCISPQKHASPSALRCLRGHRPRSSFPAPSSSSHLAPHPAKIPASCRCQGHWHPRGLLPPSQGAALERPREGMEETRGSAGKDKAPKHQRKELPVLGKSRPSPPLAPRGSFGDPPGAKGAGSQPGWGQVPPWGGSKPLVPLKRQIFAFEKPKRGRCQIFPIGHPRGAGHGAWGSLRRASHMETGSR